MPAAAADSGRLLKQLPERENPIETEKRGEESAAASDRRRWELEAEAADLKLRVDESLARERRLVDRVLVSEAALESMKRADRELRGRLESYAAFHRDLERSLVWRAIQFVRRLAGRAW